MTFWRNLVVFVAAFASAAAAQPAPDLCKAAIGVVERMTGVPDRLMQAISIVESGRRSADGTVAAWPWTINVEGVGEVFDTKQQAIAAVNAHRARGARSIDVGCMQVNLLHHGSAFASLDDAFDPGANARYAAQFLQQLLAQTGSWPRAVAGYHSLTPDLGEPYSRKVLAVWARPETPRAMASRAPAVAPPPPPAPVASGTRSLPGGGAPARVLAAPGASAPAFTGRGLDSYRALPTPLLTVGLFRRP